jgi:3-deoxy-manno-octulosonate cytidylyltransferase (CMP-KDO synthetase)
MGSVVAVVPARFGSSRLPGKPLLDIEGRPLVVRVCERARQARSLDEVIVATDDARIERAVCDAGFGCVMTSAGHASGTDRVAEVAAGLQASIIVNVQGDEPLIEPAAIDAAVEALQGRESCQMATTCEPLRRAADLYDPSVVKLATRDDGTALYFSRAPIPFPRDATPGDEEVERGPWRRHTGLYVYRRKFLDVFTALPHGRLERIEKLEQLRALEYGYSILVVEYDGRSIGVDTPEDLARVRELFAANVTECGSHGTFPGANSAEEK